MGQSLESSDLSRTQKQYSLNSIQAEAVEHCLRMPSVLLVADKGAGKTRVGLAVAAESGGRVLILCPNKVRGGWLKEGKKIARRVDVIEGTAQQRMDTIALSAACIFVMGVDLIPWLCEEYRWLPFDGLILDETTRYSKPGSSGVKKLRAKRPKLEWTLGLTASPVMENPLALYGQAVVLDGGASLGRSFDRYKQQYFMQMDYKGYDFQLRPGADTELAVAVAGLVHFMVDTSYADSLVPLTEELVYVEPPAVMWELYEEMAEKLVMDLDGTEIEAANAAVVSGKLEQLTQGAVYDGKSAHRWVHHAKFNKLWSLMKESGDEPVIITYHYIYELERLRHMFPHGRDLKDDGALDAFNDGAIHLLFMHPRSGAHGIEAQARCCEMICLKPIWSADGWDQIIGRIRRRGQTRPCRRRTLVVAGSIDEVIFDRVVGKEGIGVSLLGHLKAKAHTL